MFLRSIVCTLACVTAFLCCDNQLFGTILDFATDTNGDNTPDTTTGMIGIATFDFGNTGGGTGILPSFVQIQGPNNNPNDPRIESAYNTPVNGVLDNGSSGQFNKDVQVNEMPVINIGGVGYYQFLLDVNENSGGGNEFISLDTVRIYTTDTGGQSVTDPDNLSNNTLRYDMDAGMDSKVLLDFQLNSGSGTIDMTLSVPVWDNPNGSDYVVLYSEFGADGVVADFPTTGLEANFSYSDGFEEWAVQPIPEASSFLLVGLIGGLGLAVGGFGKRFKRGDQ